MGARLERLSPKDLDAIVKKKEKEFANVLEFTKNVAKELAKQQIEHAHNARPYTETWTVEDYFDFELEYIDYTLPGGAAASPRYWGCTARLSYKGKEVLYVTKLDGKLKQESQYKVGPWEVKLKELMADEKAGILRYKEMRSAKQRAEDEAAYERYEKKLAIEAERHRHERALERAAELGLVKKSPLTI